MDISRLTDRLVRICEEQFSQVGYSKPQGYFQGSLAKQHAGDLEFFVAHRGDAYLGHVRLLWHPDYPHFREAGIPEISDLNVLPSYRRRGLGTALIEHCERCAAEKTHTVGIGVGLYPGYNNAQRLYTRLGYILDGHGVHYKNRPVQYGEQPPFDDSLVICFTKQVRSRAHPGRTC